MGLDSFKQKEKYDEGTVHTRMKPRNIEIEEELWKWMLLYDPHWAANWGTQLDVQSAKTIIQMIDELIAGEDTPFGQADDVSIEEMREARADIVEYINRKEDGY